MKTIQIEGLNKDRPIYGEDDDYYPYIFLSSIITGVLLGGVCLTKLNE